jgi:hypothetical protein
MPTVSKKQEKFMQAVANNPKFAKKVDVPQSVGKEFTMKKMNMGGMAGNMEDPRARAMQAAMAAKGGGGAPPAPGMKKGGMAASKMGAVKTAAPSRDGVATKGKTKGTMIKMAKGGAAKKKMAYGGKC